MNCDNFVHMLKILVLNQVLTELQEFAKGIRPMVSFSICCIYNFVVFVSEGVFTVSEGKLCPLCGHFIDCGVGFKDQILLKFTCDVASVVDMLLCPRMKNFEAILGVHLQCFSSVIARGIQIYFHWFFLVEKDSCMTVPRRCRVLVADDSLNALAYLFHVWGLICLVTSSFWLGYVFVVFSSHFFGLVVIVVMLSKSMG